MRRTGRATTARAYLSAALDIMERHSVRRKAVDWAELRDSAFQAAGAARAPADTYDAIRAALRGLGDRHSFFVDPARHRAQLAEAPTSFPGPEGRALPGGLGYLALPGLAAAGRTAAGYLHAGRAELARAGRDTAPSGWVVDLRRNAGGNMWPMLGVLAPILGDGPLGSFLDPDGNRMVWSIRRGRVRLGRRVMSPRGPRPHPTPPARSVLPVAVLTGGDTASSGEAVLVAFRGRPETRSFGRATAGVPTANEGYALPDGARIVLTVALDADRTGRTYDRPIPPDEAVPFGPADLGSAGDPDLAAACRWLRTLPGPR